MCPRWFDRSALRPFLAIVYNNRYMHIRVARIFFVRHYYEFPEKIKMVSHRPSSHRPRRRVRQSPSFRRAPGHGGTLSRHGRCLSRRCSSWRWSLAVVEEVVAGRRRTFTMRLRQIGRFTSCMLDGSGDPSKSCTEKAKSTARAYTRCNTVQSSAHVRLSPLRRRTIHSRSRAATENNIFVASCIEFEPT